MKKNPFIQFNSLIKPYKYMYQTIYKRANGWLENFFKILKVNLFFCSKYLALNKQIEEFEDLFLTLMNNKDNEKTNIVLYPIGEPVQVKNFHKKRLCYLYKFL